MRDADAAALAADAGALGDQAGGRRRRFSPRQPQPEPRPPTVPGHYALARARRPRRWTSCGQGQLPRPHRRRLASERDRLRRRLRDVAALPKGVSVAELRARPLLAARRNAQAVVARPDAYCFDKDVVRGPGCRGCDGLFDVPPRAPDAVDVAAGLDRLLRCQHAEGGEPQPTSACGATAGARLEPHACLGGSPRAAVEVRLCGRDQEASARAGPVQVRHRGPARGDLERRGGRAVV
mmetsp:Transcript_159793/g.512776  ORF Transcript_159793/g.512776 Transcript_159793/m.512776 type:complete len:237 (+) Transcript_159793:289-999(+)